MIQKFDEFINEGTVYTFQVYHNSYTEAIEEALKYAKENGYSYTVEDTSHYIGINSKRPSEGKTTKISLPVTKNKKEFNLHIQIYCAGSRFELNLYIN